MADSEVAIKHQSANTTATPFAAILTTASVAIVVAIAVAAPTIAMASSTNAIVSSAVTASITGSAHSFRITCAAGIRPCHVCGELGNGDEQRPMSMCLCLVGRGQRASGSAQLRVMRARALIVEWLRSDFPRPFSYAVGSSHYFS